jgi:hypothetical protein
MRYEAFAQRKTPIAGGSPIPPESIPTLEELPRASANGKYSALPVIAVAQKSPCKGNRVIMGKAFPLKLCQRGRDAGQEVPMRTPKRLYAEKRIVYQPELLTCPHCGALLVMWNSLAWDKTVQTLDGVLSMASRPGHCPTATCRGSRMRLLSAEAQRMALPGSTYGYDVLVRIGWLRQHQRATSSEMHTALSSRLYISPSHVRSL